MQSLPVFSPPPLDVEQAVRERYSQASQQAEAALCCPVTYDPRFLAVLPDEILERDYGCGDPSQHVRDGETVLDLGSGGGKICFIASQIVGPRGRVIGVDMNDDMLSLARRHQPTIADRIGWDNVEFRKGRIQDLALDLERFERFLADHPVRSWPDWLAAQRWADEQREAAPLVASGSIDVVISNCVLNLVRPEDRRLLFREVARVLREGGRAAISDIVSDEPVPELLRRDPRLWSGCISGAFVESELLAAFAEAGFVGMEIVTRQAEPWATVAGIEFRSVTVRAYKRESSPPRDCRQAVIYRGPWRSVTDDDGREFERGVAVAVSDVAWRAYSREPFARDLIPVPPREPVAPECAPPFDRPPGSVRTPKETKGQFRETHLPAADCCAPGKCC